MKLLFFGLYSEKVVLVFKPRTVEAEAAEAKMKNVNIPISYQRRNPRANTTNLFTDVIVRNVQLPVKNRIYYRWYFGININITTILQLIQIEKLFAKR